jgi:ERCC4-type nuclease
MKIYIDNREGKLYDYLQNKFTDDSKNLIKTTLTLGDVILKTDADQEVVIIERKTISDLLSSIKDGRYREQSHRLIHSSNLPINRIIYLIEGVFQGHSEAEKQKVYSAMVSLNQVKGFSIMRTWSLEETGEVIKNMASKLQNEMDKGNYHTIVQSRVKENEEINEIEQVGNIQSSGGIEQEISDKSNDIISYPVSHYSSLVKKVKRENITPENIGEILLCQIPGISSVSANSLMKEFSSISDFIERIKTDPQFLPTFYCESNGKKRKLNKNIIENIYKYLISNINISNNL